MAKKNDTIYYVYKTTCLVTGKAYVGKHKCFTIGVEERYLGSGKILKRAIDKYGKDNFIQEILEFTSSEEENREREIYWIKKLDTMVPNGYNISPGGLGGFIGYNEEQHKWYALNTWKNITEEQYEQRCAALRAAASRPEVKEKLSKASKKWHSSLNEEAKAEWAQHCSEGWKEEQRAEAGKRIAERNKANAGKPIKQLFVERYGEEKGEIKYQEYVEKQRAASLRNKEKRSAAAKETLEKKKSFPRYKELCAQQAKVQAMRTLLKRGKLSQEEFDRTYQKEVDNLQLLKDEMRSYLNDLNNGKII